MPSPDLTDFVDLTVYDADPQTIFERALAAVADQFPGWTPREGNTEVVLLEALALEVAELVFAVNRLPGAAVEALMQLYGITRNLGEAATTTIGVFCADTLGHTVPEGTQFRLEQGTDPANWVIFSLDADLVIAPAAATGTGTATAVTPGDDWNGTPAGTRVELLDSIAFVNRAELDDPVAGGADEETTEAWLVRATHVLRRLSDTLVRPTDFEARVLEHFAQVSRAAAVNAWDPDSGNPPGTDVGHVTVLVTGPNGAAVAGPDQADIEADLTELAAANLIPHVDTPVVTSVAVTATVRRFADTPAVTVEAAAEAALAVYLDPDSWPFGRDVARNELIALLDGVPGVDLVVSITAPAVDVVVTAAQLVKPGAIAVTVTDP